MVAGLEKDPSPRYGLESVGHRHDDRHNETGRKRPDQGAGTLDDAVGGCVAGTTGLADVDRFDAAVQAQVFGQHRALTGLGRSLFDYHSQQVREHQGDWQPLLKWLKRA